MKRWRSEKVAAAPGAAPQRRTLAQWWAWLKAQIKRLTGAQDGASHTRRGGLGRTGFVYRVGS